MTEHSAKKNTALRTALRVLLFLVCTIVSLVLVVLGAIFVLEKGPSPKATETFCRSVRETSAIKWIANIYLSEEELTAMMTEEAPPIARTVDTSLVHIAESREESREEIEVIDIVDRTCKGKLMIVPDPKRVIVGTSDDLGHQAGLQLTELVAKYGGIGGINAGGFNDENGHGNGGIPQGMVITEGELVWGKEKSVYSVIGFDTDGVLHVGQMTAEEAIESGIVSAVSFDGIGASSALIVDGEVQTGNLVSGVNPRTAIGQRADGAVLLLVLDGRSIRTLGATLEDVCRILLDYGAVNAGNLDGGSSTVMVYEGEIINVCASVTGPRNIPTAFVVLGEDGA